MNFSFKNKNLSISSYKNLEFSPRSSDKAWRIVLIASFAITILIAIVGMQRFITIDSESFLKETEFSESREKINRERLESTIKYFSEKEQKTKDLLSGKEKISDPSL